MKVAILSESPADEAFIAVLAESALSRQIELVQPRLRSRGWPSVRNLLPAVYKHLMYHTDAAGLVVVVDSDDSAVHQERAGTTASASAVCDSSCRLCELRAVIARIHQSSARAPSDSLAIALGLAVPSIEAWILCGHDAHVTEAAWVNGLRERRLPYRRPELKRRAYGTDRPSLEHEVDAARAAASRLVGDTTPLMRGFPQGFGTLWRDLKTWRHEG